MPTRCAIAVTNSTDEVGSACPALSCMLQLLLPEADSSCIPSLHHNRQLCYACQSSLALPGSFTQHILLFPQMTVSRKKSWIVLSCCFTQSTRNQASHMRLHQQVTNACSHPGWATPLHKSHPFHLAIASPRCQVSSQLLACPYCLHLACYCVIQLIQATKHMRPIRAAPLVSPRGLAIPYGTHCSMACQVMTNKVNCCVQLLSKLLIRSICMLGRLLSGKVP